MATRANLTRELSMFLLGICFCVLLIILELKLMSSEGFVGYGYHSADEPLKPHVHSNTMQINPSLKTKPTMTSHLRSSANISDVYRIAIASMDIWRENKTTLPRTVICQGSQNSALLKKVNYSNLSNLKHADILIFSGIMKNKDLWPQLQLHRQSRQLWVFSTGESPFTFRGAVPLRGMNYIRFNITSTFHPRANIYVPYGRYIRSDLTSTKENRTSFVSHKKLSITKELGLVVWISSHCVTAMWRRFDFVHDLAKLIPVDMYGKCGQLSCLHNENCAAVFGKYKFVIAFENSCCGGYITEKFWNALNKFHAIPVVIGARKSDYLQQGPPHSFIHADDFESMKDLAEYILEVAENKELYDGYFKWKVNGYISQNPFVHILADSDTGVCRLLDYLQSSKSHVEGRELFDPFGPNWLGGCDQCGEHAWIRNYSNWQN